MLVCDLSVNREELLDGLSLVRIKPKSRVKKGEVCTYSLLKIDKIGKTEELNIKLDYKYGEALDLIDYTYNNNVIKSKPIKKLRKKDIIYLDISINRKKYIYHFAIKKEQLFFIPLYSGFEENILIKKDFKISNSLIKDIIIAANDSKIKFNELNEYKRLVL
jgi:hypothetical protein